MTRDVLIFAAGFGLGGASIAGLAAWFVKCLPIFVPKDW